MEPEPATPTAPERFDKSRGFEPVVPRRRRRRRRRSAAPAAGPGGHAICDHLSGGLILFLVVFTPWAFGTTQSWAIWVANIACYAMGALLVAKAIIRIREAYHPARWGEPVVVAEGSGQIATSPSAPDPVTRLLVFLTFVILAYILVSALNARAYYDEETREFIYLKEPLKFLPFSYDRSATWFVFWQYLGLACAFWAIRDWLLHRTGDDHREDDTPRWAEPQASVVVPRRVQRLLWVLCLNGTLLALVGIVQRSDGTTKLLWLLESTGYRPPENVFGPWAYRSNAAQYFNLLWPICLAFWLWTQERAGRALHRRLGRLDGPQLVLLPCAIFMAACPMISTSRGGALVSVGIGVIALLLLLLSSRREISAIIRWITVGTLVFAGLASMVGGWTAIRDRILRTDRVLPTHIETGLDDFSLLLRMRAPERLAKRWQTVASLSRDMRSTWQSHALIVALAPNGYLYVQLAGPTTTNVIRSAVTNYAAASAGHEVLLSVIRRDGLRVFADGTELETFESRGPQSPSWSDVALTRFLYVDSSSASEAALVNYALTPEEVASIGATSLTRLKDTLLGREAFTGNAAATTNDFVLSDGAAVEFVARPSDPSTRWLAVHRGETAGTLGVRQSLTGMDPRLRGPMRATFTVWNPANDSIHLGVSLDSGMAGVVEVAPRAEATVAVPCRAPHSGQPESLDIFLSDEDGAPIEDAPPESRFLIQGLSLQPDGAIFAKEMDQELRLGDLSDRLSGRPEIYENSRKMAEDHRWWGSGAGTFASMYQFYMQPNQVWAAYAHNDWLETRITLGRIGAVLVILAMGLLFLRSWVGRGLPVMRIILLLWWTSLAGCLVHAIFDFPFQIYSVLFLFTLLAAGILVLTRARQA